MTAVPRFACSELSLRLTDIHQCCVHQRSWRLYLDRNALPGASGVAGASPPAIAVIADFGIESSLARLQKASYNFSPMKRRGIRILLQTTIPTTADDWS